MGIIYLAADTIYGGVSKVSIRLGEVRLKTESGKNSYSRFLKRAICWLDGR